MICLDYIWYYYLEIKHTTENLALILGHGNVQKNRRYQPTRQRASKYGIVNEGIDKS